MIEELHWTVFYLITIVLVWGLTIVAYYEGYTAGVKDSKQINENNTSEDTKAYFIDAD